MQEQPEDQQQKHRSNKNKKTRIKKVRKLLYRIVKNRLEAEIKPWEGLLMQFSELKVRSLPHQFLIGIAFLSWNKKEIVTGATIGASLQVSLKQWVGSFVFHIQFVFKKSFIGTPSCLTYVHVTAGY